MGKRTSGRKRRARMNSPQMDMLPSEKIDARFVDSSPEIQSAIKKYNDFWGALSDAERAKLKKLHKMLVRNVKRDRAWITSDDRADYYIRKTAEEVHVDRELFDRWWSVLVPLMSMRVRFETSRALTWAKIAPGILQGDSLPEAKLAAQNLKVGADPISMEAKRDNRRFFIELGKCLSGEIKPELFDDMDWDLVRILCINPSTTAKDAVRKLEKKGWHITEEAFRVRKQRLRRAIVAARKAYDQPKKA